MLSIILLKLKGFSKVPSYSLNLSLNYGWSCHNRMRVPTTKTKLHLICIYHLVICTSSLLDHVRAVIVNCKLSSWTTALWISSDRVMSGLVIPLHITMWISSPPHSHLTHSIVVAITYNVKWHWHMTLKIFQHKNIESF